MEKNYKTCVICGKVFQCPPSSKTVTCSHECRVENRKRHTLGKSRPKSFVDKISASAKLRDMTELQKKATKAALASPKSGRFPTNVNAKEWHLIAPDGTEYHFRSLQYWLRENCEKLFGVEPDSREFNNVRSGLSGAKRAMLGGKYNSSTYKKWIVVPTESDFEQK